MSNIVIQTWTTGNEIDFIKKLGTCSLPGEKVSRNELLRGYLEGCQEREDWEKVDRAAVISFAQQELAALA